MALALHTGADRVTLKQIKTVVTPEPTKTHTPVPHLRLIDEVKDGLKGIGLRVVEQDYALNGPNGEEMFGVLGVENGKVDEDYRLTVGLRNSHRKYFSAGLTVGSHVFVCDNLAFSGEITVRRRHTANVLRDLPGLIAESLGRFSGFAEQQGRRIEAYRKTELADQQTHDLVIRSVDRGVLAGAKAWDVLKEWREPSHEDFEPRTAWSLFNAYTEVFKRVNPFTVAQRSYKLHDLMDGAAVEITGIDPQQLQLLAEVAAEEVSEN